MIELDTQLKHKGHHYSSRLEVGDFVPYFSIEHGSRKLDIQAKASRHLLLIFVSAKFGDLLGDALALDCEYQRYVITDTDAVLAHNNLFHDAGVFRLFADQDVPITACLCDRNLKICYTSQAESIAALQHDLSRLSATPNIGVPPPVLLVPNVISDELALRLIDYIDRYTDRAFHNQTDHKSRHHISPDKALEMELDDKLSKSLLPEIEKVFYSEISHRETYKICLYAADEEGHFSRHRDTIEPYLHRRYAVTVSLNDDYEDGGICFPEYSDENIKVPKNGAVVFPGSLFHQVNTIGSGRRYVVISFLFSEQEARIKQGSERYRFRVRRDLSGITLKKLTPGYRPEKKKALLPLSLAGPGNQYCGIKEAIILARVLDRSLVLPYIIPHYTIRERSRAYYTIAETFDEHLLIERCRDLMNLEVIPWSEYRSNWPTSGQITAVNIRKDQTSIAQAMGYVERYRDVMGFALSKEEVLKSRSPGAILDSAESIQKWYQTVADGDPELLVIAGLFNSLKLGGMNRSSVQGPCLKNQCLSCRPSPEFDEIYQQVNLAFRINRNIAEIGDDFILRTFQDRPFLAFHLRICDLPHNRSFPECYGNYTEDQISAALGAACRRYQIDPEDVFLAAPPQLFSAVSGLQIFTRENMRTFYSSKGDPYIASLAEQYICMRSKVFLRSRTNTPELPRKAHTRSSYAVLIEGVRLGDPTRFNFTVDEFVEP